MGDGGLFGNCLNGLFDRLYYFVGYEVKQHYSLLIARIETMVKRNCTRKLHRGGVREVSRRKRRAVRRQTVKHFANSGCHQNNTMRQGFIQHRQGGGFNRGPHFDLLRKNKNGLVLYDKTNNFITADNNKLLLSNVREKAYKVSTNLNEGKLCYFLFAKIYSLDNSMKHQGTNVGVILMPRSQDRLWTYENLALVSAFPIDKINIVDYSRGILRVSSTKAALKETTHSKDKTDTIVSNSSNDTEKCFTIYLIEEKPATSTPQTTSAPTDSAKKEYTGEMRKLCNQMRQVRETPTIIPSIIPSTNINKDIIILKNGARIKKKDIILLKNGAYIRKNSIFTNRWIRESFLWSTQIPHDDGGLIRDQVNEKIGKIQELLQTLSSRVNAVNELKEDANVTILKNALTDLKSSIINEEEKKELETNITSGLNILDSIETAPEEHQPDTEKKENK